MYPLSFEKYGLSPEILSGLADVRIENPTSLLEEMLPAALEGKHLLVHNASADEGIFLIPALQKVAEHGESAGTQVLILTPSIERATKIDEMIWAIGYHAQINSALLAMKGDKAEQEKALLEGAPVIVANPGRFIEILEKNKFRLQQLKLIVIDEAHEMENFNLVSRVKDIFTFVDNDPQVLVLSGSKNTATEKLVAIALKNPELIGFDANGAATAAPVVEVDVQAAKEKLASTSIKVVLKKDLPKEPAPEETEADINTPEAHAVKAVDLEEAQDKLQDPSVDVVLNPEAQELPQEEANIVENAPSNTEEPEAAVDVDLDQVKQKLEKSSIKVVLKKDLPAESVEKQAAKTTSKSVDENAPEPLAKDLEQGYINVPPRMKISTLMAHLEESNAQKVIVFAASKRTTDRLFRIIRKKNWGVVSVSDDLEQNVYNERFAKFTSGEMRVLLVGGIAADKVEIEAVDEVINYDVPAELEEYRYRAELVGGGKAAQIISLVSKMDRDDIKRISEEAGFPPVELPFPDELNDKKKKKAPAKKTPAKKGNKNAPRNKEQRDHRGGRSSRSNHQGQHPKKKKSAPARKPGELPRPTYDGLSGGRDGGTFNPKREVSTGGVFGWVKKLFK